jgi:hypothetical protein
VPIVTLGRVALLREPFINVIFNKVVTTSRRLNFAVWSALTTDPTTLAMAVLSQIVAGLICQPIESFTF